MQGQTHMEFKIKLQKKTSAKIDPKSLNNARVSKRNEKRKKENLKRQLQQSKKLKK